jgi:hypothetical protein
MSFRLFLLESLLLEGGAAIKNTNGVPQHLAGQLLPKLVKLIAAELKLKPTKVAAIGSAGHKPADQLSGDLDIAVETDDIDSVKTAIARLGAETQHKAMSGIKVYSFGYKHGSSLFQVDIMPVTNLEFAKWSFHAAETDLAKGLKSAHRNELLFALAHYVNLTTNSKDDPTERERYILDLSNGLYLAKQSRMGKRGKPVKGFSTVSKELVTSDKNVVVAHLLGSKFKADDMLTFDNVYDAIMSNSFEFSSVRESVLKKAAAGIKKKELLVPKQLQPFLD